MRATGGPPYDYNQVNLGTAVYTPSTIHVYNTTLAAFYRRYLMQKAMAVYEWKLPETWNKEYFLYTLYQYGYLSIFNTDKFGVICQMCGLYGYNVYYQPTNVVIANPLIKSTLMPKIDVNCVLVKMQPDYHGITDLVAWYADLMALCMETITSNMINSKLSYVMAANSKGASETLKKMYDRIASGEPAVFVDESLFRNVKGETPWKGFVQDVGSNYIVSDALSDMRKIEQMFDTVIGINNANTDKRERLITAEAESNNFEVKCLSDMWLDNIKEGFDKANRMFGLNLSVKRRDNGNEGDTVTTGTV